MCIRDSACGHRPTSCAPTHAHAVRSRTAQLSRIAGAAGSAGHAVIATGSCVCGWSRHRASTPLRDRLPFWRCHWLTPVSYTHLDVYKRQQEAPHPPLAPSPTSGRREKQLAITVAAFDDGFALDAPPLCVLTERQLFPERASQPRRRKRAGREPEAIIRDLGELSLGAPIVHEDHGVGPVSYTHLDVYKRQYPNSPAG